MTDVVKTPVELSSDEFHESMLGVTAEGLAPLEQARLTGSTEKNWVLDAVGKAS